MKKIGECGHTFGRQYIFRCVSIDRFEIQMGGFKLNATGNVRPNFICLPFSLFFSPFEKHHWILFDSIFNLLFAHEFLFHFWSRFFRFLFVIISTFVNLFHKQMAIFDIMLSIDRPIKRSHWNQLSSEQKPIYINQKSWKMLDEIVQCACFVHGCQIPHKERRERVRRHFAIRFVTDFFLQILLLH